jgi:hypothetical protein
MLKKVAGLMNRSLLSIASHRSRSFSGSGGGNSSELSFLRIENSVGLLSLECLILLKEYLTELPMIMFSRKKKVLVN